MLGCSDKNSSLKEDKDTSLGFHLQVLDHNSDQLKEISDFSMQEFDILQYQSPQADSQFHKLQAKRAFAARSSGDRLAFFLDEVKKDIEAGKSLEFLRKNYAREIEAYNSSTNPKLDSFLVEQIGDSRFDDLSPKQQLIHIEYLRCETYISTIKELVRLKRISLTPSVPR